MGLAENFVKTSKESRFRMFDHSWFLCRKVIAITKIQGYTHTVLWIKSVLFGAAKILILINFRPSKMSKLEFGLFLTVKKFDFHVFQSLKIFQILIFPNFKVRKLQFCPLGSILRGKNFKNDKNWICTPVKIWLLKKPA